MLDSEKREQEAYERGYDLDEQTAPAATSAAGKLSRSALEIECDRMAAKNRTLRLHRRIWMILTWVGSALLIVVCFVFWHDQKKNNGEPSPDNSSAKSYRICSDVEDRINRYNEKDFAYKASLRNVLGTEYVAFSYGNAENPEYVLLYRNEYPSESDAKKGEFGAWMETTEMIDYTIPYTLADDWSLLTPNPVIMAGTKYVLFVQEYRGIPKSVVVLEPGFMNVGESQDCFAAVRNWFSLAVSSAADDGASSDNSEFVVMTTGHGNKYHFSASADALAAVRENIFRGK